MNIDHCYNIFEEAVIAYHERDEIEFTVSNPYEVGTMNHLLFAKAYIDSIQWHCEDVVRDPSIDAEKVRYYKVKIDKLNQERTNMVEQIDDFFLETYRNIAPAEQARLNTESPAWAVDRLSILALKLYHMNIEANRADLSHEKWKEYQSKLQLLQEQKRDLTRALENLLAEIERGETVFKVYRQVKMYNDMDLNPVLRKSNAD